MQTSERKSRLYLVHSSSTNNARQTVAVTIISEFASEEGVQLELFQSEKPDAIIFAQAMVLDLDDIKKLIADGHATRIIDLREVPYMTFGDETRESFLKVLDEQRVKYYNLAMLGSILGNKVLQANDFFDSTASFARDNVRIELKKLVETGPTVVFSDTDPAQDKLVKQFQSGLTQANIEFSPYFTKQM